MKMNPTIPSRLLGGLHHLTVGTALLLLVNPVINCQAQNTPVNTTWDCVMSGPRQGIAYITFSDLTFTGYEVLVPKGSKNSSGSIDLRGNGSRGDTSDSSTNTPNTQLFGAAPIDGQWGFDIQGRIIGSFAEAQPESCITNAIPVATNGTGLFGLEGEYSVEYPDGTNTVTIFYTNQVTCSGMNNAISFVGKVVTGKRLTLVCSTSFGKVVYRGVPAVTLSNLNGNWYGIKNQNHQSFVEFFTASDSVLPGAIPTTTYDIAGNGPGYSYSGIALLSSQKKFALVAGINPDGQVLRAVYGSFNLKNMSTKTRGWEQPEGIFGNPVRFDAVLQPVVP
jgi:hypothetical protein